ncbi:MAG: GntR family transcriptional regulator [Agathobacter sp.]|nr:GntR family transcriptional regulator [Agathobacter sp.]
MIQLNYRDSRPIYEQIKDGIKQLIYTEVLEADDKLPSVRDLASKLAINPNTISRAYKELEQEGVIYTLSGKGTFISGDFKGKEEKTKELLVKFDEIIKELYQFEVTPEQLTERIKTLAKGGNADDSSK